MGHLQRISFKKNQNENSLIHYIKWGGWPSRSKQRCGNGLKTRAEEIAFCSFLTYGRVWSTFSFISFAWSSRQQSFKRICPNPLIISISLPPLPVMDSCSRHPMLQGKALIKSLAVCTAPNYSGSLSSFALGKCHKGHFVNSIPSPQSESFAQDSKSQCLFLNADVQVFLILYSPRNEFQLRRNKVGTL